jgi:ABC-type uncharacterized transport system substrate-binding protein
MRARGSVFSTLLILAAVFAVPLRGEAQQIQVHRVGVVHQGGAYTEAVDGLRDGLRELGFEEGKQGEELPTMFQERGIVAQGALAAYGESYYRGGRLSAKQVQRVLLGADPGDLPVEQSDRLHFVLNMKTAKAIGITIPPAVLARADEVI